MERPSLWYSHPPPLEVRTHRIASLRVFLESLGGGGIVANIALVSLGRWNIFPRPHAHKQSAGLESMKSFKQSHVQDVAVNLYPTLIWAVGCWTRGFVLRGFLWSGLVAEEAWGWSSPHISYCSLSRSWGSSYLDKTQPVLLLPSFQCSKTGSVAHACSLWHLCMRCPSLTWT